MSEHRLRRNLLRVTVRAIAVASMFSATVLMIACRPADSISAQCKWITDSLVNAQKAIPGMSPADQALARKQLPPSIVWAGAGCNIHGPHGLSSDGAINTLESKLLIYAQVAVADGHPRAELAKPSEILIATP